MSAETLLAFALLSLIIEITPGPNMVYLVVLSLSRGWRAGLAAVAGVALGLATYGVAAAFGVAVLIEQSPLAYAVLRWTGIAYLVWLAWDAWATADAVPDGAAPGDLRDGFLRGLITNLLNPKAAIFYVAMLPAYINEARGGIFTQTLLLSAVYVAIATLVHASLVIFAGSMRGFFASGQRALVQKALALVLLAVAVWFAFATARS